MVPAPFAPGPLRGCDPPTRPLPPSPAGPLRPKVLTAGGVGGPFGGVGLFEPWGEAGPSRARLGSPSPRPPREGGGGRRSGPSGPRGPLGGPGPRGDRAARSQGWLMVGRRAHAPCVAVRVRPLQRDAPSAGPWRAPALPQGGRRRPGRDGSCPLARAPRGLRPGGVPGGPRPGFLGGALRGVAGGPGAAASGGAPSSLGPGSWGAPRNPLGRGGASSPGGGSARAREDPRGFDRRGRGHARGPP